MPISKRKLTEWRKRALKNQEYFKRGGQAHDISAEFQIDSSTQILLLTQELLDQQLLKEK